MHHPIKPSLSAQDPSHELIHPAESIEGTYGSSPQRIQGLQLFSLLCPLIQSTLPPISTITTTTVEASPIQTPVEPAPVPAKAFSIDSWAKLRERARTFQSSSRDWIRSPIIKTKKLP